MFDAFAITPMQAIVFGLLTLPVSAWVVYSDVTEMKIKNMAVLAMLVIFLLAGPFLMPLGEYGTRWIHFAVVLLIGYLLSATVGFGAGDMKYMAAVAPYVALPDLSQVALLFVFWTIALLTMFWAARRSQALRTAAPGWVWLNTTSAEAGGRRKLKTPFGVALAPTVSTYFLLAAIA